MYLTNNDVLVSEYLDDAFYPWFGKCLFCQISYKEFSEKHRKLLNKIGFVDKRCSESYFWSGKIRNKHPLGKTRIDQEIFKYRSPADKRAIKFLFDAKFDSADFEKNVRGLLNEDGQLDGNVPKEKLVSFFNEALGLS